MPGVGSLAGPSALGSSQGAEVSVRLTRPLPSHPQEILAKLQLPWAECSVAEAGLSG